MSNQNDQREPSMEEILASIRQIISEDGDETPGKAADAAEPEPPAPAAEPLDLTHVVNEDGSVTDLTQPEPAAEAGLAPSPDAFGEPVAPPAEEAAVEPLPEAEPAPIEPPSAAPQAPVSAPEQQLVSPDRAEAVQSALGLLSSQTRVRGQADPATLEGLVTEMLRPLLKEWLDANLPGLVERAVREEIERISKRAR